MSKFKSATDIAVTEFALKALALKALAMGAFAMGTLTLVFVSSVCTAQYCSSCSGGSCSPQLEAPVYSGSIATPVAYESTLSNGYSQSYTPSYSSSGATYGYPSPVYSANTYSGSPVMASSTDYGTVINSTYASPSYEQLDSSFIPSTTVSNLSLIHI